MPGLTTAQIEEFYRTLEFADALAAAERQRLRENLDALIQQDARGKEQDSTAEVEIRQRLRDSRTQHLNSATLFTLMERPPKYALEGDGSDRQRVRLRRLYELFKSQRVLLWSFPEDIFEGEETAELSEMTAPCLISVVEEYADAVISQAVLPLLGREPSTARVDRRMIRTLMAAAVAQRRFRFETVEAANEFFAEAYRRFLATRSLVVDGYLTAKRYEELHRRVTSHTNSKVHGNQHEQDREDIVADVLLKVTLTLEDPRFPPPSERFATDDDLFHYVSRMTRNRIAELPRTRGNEPDTVSLPDSVEDATPVPAPPTDHDWQAVSRILNEELEQGFGADSICSSIDAAEAAFVPGAAIAFLMLLRRQHGQEGYSEDEALAEIRSAADGSWTPGAKQFVNANDHDVSPEQLWESCHPAWSSLLIWRGELPALRLPESWSSLTRLFPANGAVTETAFDAVHRQWAGFVGAIDNLRRWIVLQVLKTTSVEIPARNGPRIFRPLTWKMIHQLLTEPVDSDLSLPGSDAVGETLSPQARWSLINDQVESAGLPASWPLVQSWFEGRIHGGHDSLRITSAKLHRILKELAHRARKVGPGGTSVPTGKPGRHPVADVTRRNGLWYLATAVFDELSGRQAAQVLGSQSGTDWRPVGSGSIVADQELTLPRFESRSQRAESDDRAVPSIPAVPSIQVEVHGQSPPASLVSSYSLDANAWTPPESVLTAGRLLSQLLWHDDRLWVLSREPVGDASSNVWLYSGTSRDSLQPRDDLIASMVHADAEDAPQFRSDLAAASRAVLFARDSELWCVLHCAGFGGRRTWIGVRALKSASGWEWWQAGTALFPEHRYVVPDPAEFCRAVRPGCAVSPAGVCQLEDGTWWMSGAAHEDGRTDADAVLCRIFFPDRGTGQDAPSRPVFCQTRVLGTGPSSALPYNGLASSGSMLLTTFHTTHPPLAGRQRTPAATGPSLLTRIFRAVTANKSRV